jgi:hypothetical protein
VFEEFVYKLTDPFTMEVRYVGRTVEPLERLKAHIYQTNGGTDKDVWIIDLRNSGTFPIMEVIEKVTSGNGAERERYHIKFYQRQGANLFNKVHNKPELKIIGYTPKQSRERIFSESLKATFKLPESIKPFDRWALMSLIYLCNGEETPREYTLKELYEKTGVSISTLKYGTFKRLEECGLLTHEMASHTTFITIHISNLLERE